MTRRLRRVSGILVLGGAAPLIMALAAGSPPAGSPYVSALSDLVAGPVFAVPSDCQRRACNTRGLCSVNQGTNCRHAGGECQTTAC